MRNETKLTMPTNIPTAKLIVAQIAVFVVPILWYWLAKYTPVPLPENGQDILDALFQSVVLSLFGLGAGWLKRPAARDVPVQENGQPAPPPPTN